MTGASRPPDSRDEPGHDVADSPSRRIGAWGVLGIAVAVALAAFAPHYPPKSYSARFDEGHYLGVLERGWASVREGETSPYYGFKSLPFLTVRQIGRYSETDGLTLRRYYWDMLFFNSACLAVAVWAVCWALRSQGLSQMWTIAFVLLAGNRAFLHFYLQFPRLGDPFALMLGALLALGHFTRRKSVVWLVLLASTMSCHQVTAASAVLLAFPLRDGATPVYSRKWHVLGAAYIGIPLLTAGFAAFYLRPEIVQLAESWGNPKYFKSPVVVALSAVASVMALYFAARPLAYWRPRSLWEAASVPSAIVAVCLVLAVRTSVHNLAIDAAAPQVSGTVPLAIKGSYLLSKPGPPGLPSSILFFGLAGAFAMLMWPRMSRWIAEQGVGFTLAFCASLMLFGLDGEVRHMLFLLPSIIVGLCLVGKSVLLEFGWQRLLWANLLLSLNWLVFLHTDASYQGERLLSAFGMCWSPIHYVFGMTLAGVTLAFLAIWLRGVQGGDARRSQWEQAATVDP